MRKAYFAKYTVEGGNPNVDSLFFYKIDSKLNIVTIIHLDKTIGQLELMENYIKYMLIK
jgi:hypothetical protein